MPISAKTLLEKASLKLFDEDFDRWTVFELLQDLNDGQMQIVYYKPDANAQHVTFPLVSGAIRQTLPSTALFLMDIPQNTGGAMIKIMDRQLLAATTPTWHTDTDDYVEYYCYDKNDSKQFYVYPIPDSVFSVDLLVSEFPTACNSSLTETAVIANVTDNIGVEDEYANPLLDFILFRAFSKDIDSSSQQRASMFFQSFRDAMGIKGQVEDMNDPNLPPVSVSEEK